MNRMGEEDGKKTLKLMAEEFKSWKDREECNAVTQ